jgi:hypothetical protein
MPLDRPSGQRLVGVIALTLFATVAAVPVLGAVDAQLDTMLDALRRTPAADV